jgi:hypothetical protein
MGSRYQNLFRLGASRLTLLEHCLTRSARANSMATPQEGTDTFGHAEYHSNHQMSSSSSFSQIPSDVSSPREARSLSAPDVMASPWIYYKTTSNPVEISGSHYMESGGEFFETLTNVPGSGQVGPAERFSPQGIGNAERKIAGEGDNTQSSSTKLFFPTNGIYNGRQYSDGPISAGAAMSNGQFISILPEKPMSTSANPPPLLHFSPPMYNAMGSSGAIGTQSRVYSNSTYENSQQQNHTTIPSGSRYQLDADADGHANAFAEYPSFSPEQLIFASASYPIAGDQQHLAPLNRQQTCSLGDHIYYSNRSVHTGTGKPI